VNLPACPAQDVLRHLNAVTVKAVPPAQPPSSTDFGAAWEKVRANGDIQFEPFAKQVEPQPPPWLKSLGEWLERVAGPVLEALIVAWPVLRIILLVLLAAGILALLYVFLRPYVEARRDRLQQEPDTHWVPDRDSARQLLEEADQLAAAGQYDEAAHLLLFRSIADIEKRQLHALRPSHTAREIGAFESLSDTARATFAVISGYVESSLFGRRPLDEAAWTRSRAAYSAFALDRR